MKVEIVFMIVAIALVMGSEHSDDTEVTKPTEDVMHTTPSGVKRLTPNYQKNIQRFTIPTPSTVRRTTSSHVYKPSHKPVTLKIKTTSPKTKFWKMAPTRRSFMKPIQFTMSPLSTAKRPEFSNIKRENGRRFKSILLNKKDATDNDNSSEEISETSRIKKQNNEKYPRPSISPLHRLRAMAQKSKIPVDIPNSNDLETKQQVEVTTTTTTKSTMDSESDISSEELEDREEFIFVKPKESQQNSVEVEKDDSIESDETATIKEPETKTRRRRSINVIEEENLGTTVSGFKFTGKVAPLSSDLMFRNINT